MCLICQQLLGNFEKMLNAAHHHRHAERGNAFFLILIAVALFAALSYVITQGGKTGNIGDKDDKIAAFARLVQFPVSVQTTVNKMLLTGADVTELDFRRDAKGKGAVFEHMQYQNPPLSIGASTDWGFKGVSKEGEGWFVSGIGTDDAGGKDVFIYLDGLSKDGCEHVKKALGLATLPLSESFTVDLEKPGTAGATAGNNAWSFNIHNAVTPPDPQPASCVRNGNRKGEPNYVYYHVIVAK